MERVYESGAAAGAPAAPAAPSTGYPTAGNPGLGVEATKPGAYWFYMITEEIRNVIAAAGITPDHEALNQLLLALQSGFGLAKSLSTPGHCALPGGLILQWGDGNRNASGTVSVVFPVTFPVACRVVLATDQASSTGTVEAMGEDSAARTPSGATFYGSSAVVGTFRWFALGN